MYSTFNTFHCCLLSMKKKLRKVYISNFQTFTYSVVGNCIESLKFFHFFATKLFLCRVKQNIKLLFIPCGTKKLQTYIAY